jgi:hypothetical protein
MFRTPRQGAASENCASTLKLTDRCRWQMICNPFPEIAGKSRLHSSGCSQQHVQNMTLRAGARQRLHPPSRRRSTRHVIVLRTRLVFRWERGRSLSALRSRTTRVQCASYATSLTRMEICTGNPSGFRISFPMIAGRLGKIRRMIEGSLSSSGLQTMPRITFFAALSDAGPVTECGGRADGGALGVAAKW